MNKAFFIFGAILPCVYIAGWTGFSIEANWFMLWALLPLALLSVRINVTPAHAIGATFLVWVALSATWTPGGGWAIEAALKLGAGAAAFMIGAEVEDDEWLWKGLAVGIAVNSGVAIAQYLGWGMGLTGGTAAGLLFNSNALAEPAALVAFIMLLDGRILWALPAIPAIVLPGTRAGFAVLAVGVLAWLWSRSRLAALSLIAMAALGLATYGPGRVPSTEQRVAIWQDTLSGITALGHGLGSFGREYPHYATRIDVTRERPFHAHSDLLEVTFEFGFLGLALFAALCAACWGSAAQRERICLLPCFALLAFDFPLYVPTTSFIVAFLAGRAAAGWRERGVERVAGGYAVPLSDEVRRSLWPSRSQYQVPL